MIHYYLPFYDASPKKRGKKERKQLTTHFPETGTPFSKWTLQDYQNIILIILIKY